jgi:hypothetical protein
MSFLATSIQLKAADEQANFDVLNLNPIHNFGYGTTAFALAATGGAAGELRSLFQHLVF